MTNVMNGRLIVETYRSLKGELDYLPAVSPRRRRVFRALCALEQRASHRRVHVERNAEPLPLDLSWEAPW